MQTSVSPRSDASISPIFFLGMSVVIWLMATLVFRVWGHLFFDPLQSVSMMLSFAASLVLLPPLVYSLFLWQRLQPQQYWEAAIYLAIPGLWLDVVSTYWFSLVFPNMPLMADGPIGAWLLWGYSIVFLTTAILRRFAPLGSR